MFYVYQKFYDNGRVDIQTLTEREVMETPNLVGLLQGGGTREGKKCDEYIDAFASKKAAKEFAEQEI